MKAESLLAALDLPVGSRVDRRVPKKLLLENGAPTSADKRYINEGIEELFWLAALKPTTIGIPEYRDETREYLEIAVLRLILRSGAKTTRLVELVHRAIPYPVLLMTEYSTQVDLSCVHKRWAQNEGDKTVLDGDVIAAECDGKQDGPHESDFLTALALGQQPRTTLYTLYQGWIDTLLALKAARLTGQFKPANNGQHAAARHESLNDCARLGTEISRLRTAAVKEKQVARQVDLNLEIKRLESQLQDAKNKL